GVTRLMEIVGTYTVLPFDFTLPLDGVFSVMVTAPRLAPMGRPVVLAVAMRFVPPAATIPEAGATVSHGSCVVAVNVWPANSAAMGTVKVTLPPVRGTDPSLPCEGRMKIAAVGP